MNKHITTAFAAVIFAAVLFGLSGSAQAYGHGGHHGHWGGRGWGGRGWGGHGYRPYNDLYKVLDVVNTVSNVVHAFTPHVHYSTYVPPPRHHYVRPTTIVQPTQTIIQPTQTIVQPVPVPQVVVPQTTYPTPVYTPVYEPPKVYTQPVQVYTTQPTTQVVTPVYTGAW